jgi:hypothetical protein
MATVTGFTAERMLEIIDATIVSAEIDVNSHLILETHAGSLIDAGGLPVPDASDSVKGIIELATEAELIAGTDGVLAVTPDILVEKIITYIDSDDYDQTTATDQYPVGESILYLNAADATAGGWDFGGKWGIVRTIRYGTDAAQTWQRVGDSSIQPEYWNRCGNLAGAWTAWAKHDAGTILFGKIYPVGSIYISTVSTNPNTLFGIGTWAAIQGRFLIGADGTYTAGSTGGAADHTLATANMPSHSHSLTSFSHLATVGASGGGASDNGGGSLAQGATSGRFTHVQGVSASTISNTGSGTAVNHLPPYLAVYMWQRTA